MADRFWNFPGVWQYTFVKFCFKCIGSIHKCLPIWIFFIKKIILSIRYFISLTKNFFFWSHVLHCCKHVELLLPLSLERFQKSPIFNNFLKKCRALRWFCMETSEKSIPLIIFAQKYTIFEYRSRLT